jgi:glycosyltransferase involved in cell wall biosynthesis
MKNNTGVSIIVYAQNEGLLIDRFLKTFFETNTHQPVEFIILGQGFTGRSEEDINQYATRAFIRHIKCSWNASIVASYNNAVKKTRYPYLLFLMDEYVFASDLLPYALDKLADSFVGAVERHRDGDSENMLAGKETGALYPGSSRAFLFCRKADFKFIGGFSEQYAPGLKSDDCYLELRTRLNNKCACIKDLPAQPRKDVAKLRILFVLPQPLDSNCGYHVERLASGLQEHGAECIAAVPQKNVMSQETREKSADTGLPPAIRHSSLHAYTYGEIQNNGISFSDGRGPDIIHAWTPREGVRKFVEVVRDNYPCPLVIHLEDNEEYLTETAVGRQFADLEKLSEQELDALIPLGRYHPRRGRIWLEQAQGLTMVIDTLKKFNLGRLPSLTLLPPPDERLFYPRPINLELRRNLKIPEKHTVLVYNGNVHAGNRDEVLTLYEAVNLLNQKGISTTLIRTGINARQLTDGDDTWVKSFEKHLGWVNREEIPDIMAAADIFVQPGMPGPFNDYRIPCKLPEYFAMGRPVILPRTNLGLKVEHGQDAIVLVEATVENIAGAVAEIVNNKELFGKLSEAAVNCYLLSIADISFLDRLFAFYRQILVAFSLPVAPSLSKLRCETKMPMVSLLQNKQQAITEIQANPITQPSILSLASPIVSQQWVDGVMALQEAFGDEISVVPSFDNAIMANRLPYQKPWFGFVHAMPLKVQNWLAKIKPYCNFSNSNTFSSPLWNQSKSKCLGLFVFSSAHAKRLELLSEATIKTVHYPMPIVKTKWSWSAFEANPVKKIIQVGWWLQRVHAIHALPVNGIEKVWVKPYDPHLDDIIVAEYKELKSRYIIFDYMIDSVKTVEDITPEEYELLLCENILFAHYYDANSLSLLMECISRNAPILINAHSAFREVLGDDYPLFYYFYKDAAEKVLNIELLQKAHEHLRSLSEQIEFKPEKLVEAVRQSIEKK